MIQLIDYQNMVYRYASSMRLSVKIHGVEVNTSALYGLVSFIKHTRFPIVFCVEGYPKLFKSYYPLYKGNRSKEAEETVGVPAADMIQIALGVAKALGVDCQFAFSPNQEADQVIASLSKAYFNKRFRLFKPAAPDSDWYFKRYSSLRVEPFRVTEIDYVLIKTTDSDMYQLIMPGQVELTDSLDSYEGITETPKAVMHLPYYTIPVYKALIGDVSDNIPCLVKKFDKTRLQSILQDALSTREDLDRFISYTKQNLKYQGAEDLQKHLRDNDFIRQLQLNRNITTLDFYSMPWSLHENPDFNLPEALKKYRIRL